MIYLLISNGRCCNKTEQIEKKDCRLVRQPLSLLPDKTKEYVESTKNEKLRFERRLAYTSLFCGLKEFFGVENAEIEKTKTGKPYLVLDCSCDIKQNVKKSTSKNCLPYITPRSTVSCSHIRFRIRRVCFLSSKTTES